MNAKLDAASASEDTTCQDVPPILSQRDGDAVVVPDGGGKHSEPILIDLMSDLVADGADRRIEMRPAHIYVIEADGLGLFKIGLSIDFKIRFPTYKTECPVACRPLIVASVPAVDVYGIERELHKRFAHVRAKGEWFALSPDDLRALPAAIREVARAPLRAAKKEIKEFCSPYDSGRLKSVRREEAWMAKLQQQMAIPTDEYVLDRLRHAAELGERIGMPHLVRSIDRKPQAVHAATRWLIEAGKIAIVHPLRHPKFGSFAFDQYRYCDLIIPDVTCDWEVTSCGTEVQVSEPLGRIVPEYFGLPRNDPKPDQAAIDRLPKRKFRQTTAEVNWSQFK